MFERQKKRGGRKRCNSDSELVLTNSTEKYFASASPDGRYFFNQSIGINSVDDIYLCSDNFCSENYTMDPSQMFVKKGKEVAIQAPESPPQLSDVVPPLVVQNDELDMVIQPDLTASNMIPQPTETIRHQNNTNQILHQNNTNQIIHQNNTNQILHQNNTNQILHQSNANQILHQNDPNQMLHQTNTNQMLHQNNHLFQTIQQMVIEPTTFSTTTIPTGLPINPNAELFSPPQKMEVVKSIGNVNRELLPPSSTTGLWDAPLETTKEDTKGKKSINRMWVTMKEDKKDLKDKGLEWKSGKWSFKEEEILQNSITKFCEEHKIENPSLIIFSFDKKQRKHFYRTVAEGLNRPLFAVYRKIQRIYDTKNYIGTYSKQEVDELVHLHGYHGNDWREIAGKLGRSSGSVRDKARLIKFNQKKGKWEDSELTMLSKAVREQTNTSPGESITADINWCRIAEHVQGRTEKQCRAKWLNFLNWKECGGKEWNSLDDLRLIDSVNDLQSADETTIDWTKMAQGWLSVRSPQWLKARWWSLKTKVPKYQTLSFTEIVCHLVKDYRQVLLLKMNDKKSKHTSQNPLLVLGADEIGNSIQPALQPSLFVPKPFNSSAAICDPIENNALLTLHHTLRHHRPTMMPVRSLPG